MTERTNPGAARAAPAGGADPVRSTGREPSRLAFESHRSELKRYLARSLGRDRASADDLVQDVFVRALAAGDRAPADEGARPWLFRIATNLVIDHHRAARRRGGSDEPADEALADGAESPEAAAIREDLRGRIRAAIARLPDEQREVFVLREHANVPFKEIALMTGAPLGTVLARMHHAMTKIRKDVESSGKTGTRARGDAGVRDAARGKGRKP